MNTRTLSMVALMALVVLSGCGRYSLALRRSYDSGRYAATVARCENDALAASQRWNASHQARYHVYCGMAYLNMGDAQRAASELVVAEHMRLGNPRLITGRDLARLSQGLMQLFGVPAGQLEIQQGTGAIAQGPAAVTPPDVEDMTVAPPEAPPAFAEPPADESRVDFSAGATVNVDVETTPVEVPAAPSVDILAPAAPVAPAAPPVIVIPPEDAAVIE